MRSRFSRHIEIFNTHRDDFFFYFDLEALKSHLLALTFFEIKFVAAPSLKPAFYNRNKTLIFACQIKIDAFGRNQDRSEDGKSFQAFQKIKSSECRIFQIKEAIMRD